MTKIVNRFFVLFLFCFIAACSSDFQARWKGLTPEGKAAAAMKIYNEEYQDYMKAAQNSSLLSSSQIKMLKEKRKILIKIYPLILQYKQYVDGGLIPPTSTEIELFNSLKQLIQMKLNKIE